MGAQPEVRADLFVFAVQTCTDHDAYDVLDLAQWEFYVVPPDAFRGYGYRTIGVSWVRRQAVPVAFAQLAEAVKTMA